MQSARKIFVPHPQMTITVNVLVFVNRFVSVFAVVYSVSKGGGGQLPPMDPPT